jgi:hypothetical protein
MVRREGRAGKKHKKYRETQSRSGDSERKKRRI